MFGLVEFRLLWTMHGCMCECVWVWGLLQSFPSGQAEAVLYFFLFSFFSFFLIFFFLGRKENPKHWTPLLTNTVPNLTPCCVSRPGLWPPEQCHPFEKKRGQVGWGGWTWEGWRVTWVSLTNPSMTSHPPLAIIWPVSLGFFMARWDVAWRGAAHYSVASTPLSQMVQSNS